MKARNKIIIFLIVFGISLFGIVEGVIKPKMDKSNKQYLENQQDPLFHDIESVLKYKNKYMGDASNISNLFYTLPLSDSETKFELFPDELRAEVNYRTTVLDIGEEKVKKSLIYNSTVAFALIDNLEAINFNFTGESYKVLRKDVEKWYEAELSSLTEKDTWNKLVQNKLSYNEYVREFERTILKKE